MTGSSRPFAIGLEPMAPRWLTIDGPINGESFRTYVEQVLVPELRPENSGPTTSS